MNEYQKNQMSFLDHLEELRWHLIRSFFAVLIVSVIAFFLKSFIFDQLLFGPKNPDFYTYQLLCELSQKLHLDDSLCIEKLPFVVQSRSMAGQFSAHMWMSIWAGFILAFPYIIFEFWKFISPGLYPQERKNSRGFIFISSLLFFMGILFGYYVITPMSINFLSNYSASSQIENNIDLASYISIIKTSVLSCGIVFELPIIIYFLSKVGIVTADFLRKYRKHSLVVVLALAAIITPPDVLSQIIVTIPIIILYEISIFIAKMIENKNKKAKA